MSDRIAGVLLTAIAIFYVIGAGAFQAGFGDPLGPAAFPRIIGIPAAVLAASLVIWPGPEAQWASGRHLAKQAAAVAVLLLYGVVLEPLGFVIATFLLIGLMAVLMGGKPVKALILAVVGSPVLFLLFDKLLGLPLPLVGTIFG